MLKRVQHDSEVRVRYGKKVEKYEMLKQVRHDSLISVWYDSLVGATKIPSPLRGEGGRARVG